MIKLRKIYFLLFSNLCCYIRNNFNFRVVYTYRVYLLYAYLICAYSLFIQIILYFNGYENKYHQRSAKPIGGIQSFKIIYLNHQTNCNSLFLKASNDLPRCIINTTAFVMPVYVHANVMCYCLLPK